MGRVLMGMRESLILLGDASFYFVNYMMCFLSDVYYASECYNLALGRPWAGAAGWARAWKVALPPAHKRHEFCKMSVRYSDKGNEAAK